MGRLTGQAKFLAQAGHQNHRKFQSLALVDGHDPNHIIVFRNQADLPGSDFFIPDGIDVSDEIVQTLPASLAELNTTIHQEAKVRLSLSSSRQGTCIEIIARFLHQFPDEFIQGHGPGQLLPARNHSESLFSFLPEWSWIPVFQKSLQGFKKAPSLPPNPDFCQIA